MKKTKTWFNNELKQLDIKQLREKLDQLRRELFSLRLNSQTAHVKDHSLFQKLRKDIARVLTIMHVNEAQQ